MGFCLFNNIAVAARFAQAEHRVDRILIVDFDVHHGNGTQAVFYRDPGVLYFSTHQYPFYPGTGDWREIGESEGEGYTVNIPFPYGVGDEGYRRAFEDVLVPITERYRPQLILVSAGYDAHWDDPLAGMQLSIAGYAEMVRQLIELAEAWCQGRLVIMLEGGYHLDVLAHSVLTTFRLLEHTSAPVSDPFGPAPRPERPVDDLLRRVREVHGLT
jgi:acetoin utilization deacetylase AcuC-like enzyme